jgi:hypothetical protein
MGPGFFVMHGFLGPCMSWFNLARELLTAREIEPDVHLPQQVQRLSLRKRFGNKFRRNFWTQLFIWVGVDKEIVLVLRRSLSELLRRFGPIKRPFN